MKAEMPAANPASIVNARAGLAITSANNDSPARTDGYNVFVNEKPVKIKIGIATKSPTDHQPDVVFGVILQSCFFIIIHIQPIKQTNHPLWTFI